MRLLGIAHTKPCIKFEISSSSSFKDTVHSTYVHIAQLHNLLNCIVRLQSQLKL